MTKVNKVQTKKEGFGSVELQHELLYNQSVRVGLEKSISGPGKPQFN